MQALFYYTFFHIFLEKENERSGDRIQEKGG